MSTATYKGEEYAIYGTAGDGAIARLATAVRLYTSASSPDKSGLNFTEVSNGCGYVTGGHAVSRANWVYSQPPSRIKLDSQTWTASGGCLVNIAGAYLTDASGNVLCWWPRATITLNDGESITFAELTFQK
jgi:hypothetical protein